MNEMNEIQKLDDINGDGDLSLNLSLLMAVSL
jgi:hypothetical protein